MNKLSSLATNNEHILSEHEAIKFEKIFNKTPVGLINHDLILRVYDRIEKRFHGRHFALEAAYLLGYIHGIRAERKRRKNKTYMPYVDINSDDHKGVSNNG